MVRVDMELYVVLGMEELEEGVKTLCVKKVFFDMEDAVLYRKQQIRDGLVDDVNEINVELIKVSRLVG